MRTLTETERNTLVHGLQVAAERFREDAHALQGDTSPQGPRLIQQFNAQSNDSIKLAEEIENADAITIQEER